MLDVGDGFFGRWPVVWVVFVESLCDEVSYEVEADDSASAGDFFDGFVGEVSLPVRVILAAQERSAVGVACDDRA